MTKSKREKEIQEICNKWVDEMIEGRSTILTSQWGSKLFGTYNEAQGIEVNALKMFLPYLIKRVINSKK